MFQMLGAFAQFERALIKERQKEGIDVAQAKGKKFGAPPKVTSHQVIEIHHQLTLNSDKSQVAKQFGISRPTPYTSWRKLNLSDYKFGAVNTIAFALNPFKKTSFRKLDKLKNS